jgi:hypothetical protein
MGVDINDDKESPLPSSDSQIPNKKRSIHLKEKIRYMWFSRFMWAAIIQWGIIATSLAIMLDAT